MSKYINADDLEYGLTHLPEQVVEQYGIREFLKVISNFPSADVVEVVRCKDCRRYRTNDEGEQYCPFVKGLRKPKPDDFCSYGERRTDGIQDKD